MQEYYWNTFDKYCASLTKEYQLAMVEKLKDAQNYLNGLTEGWHEYLIRIKKVQSDFKNLLDKEENKGLDYLIKSIDKMLKNRWMNNINAIQQCV